MKIDLRDLGFNAYKHLADKLDESLNGEGKLFEGLDETVRGGIGEVLHTRNSIEVHDGLAAVFKIGQRIIQHRKRILEHAATNILENGK